MPSSNYWMTREFPASVISTMTSIVWLHWVFVAVIFSSCSVSLIAVHGLLIVAASILVEQGLLSVCTSAVAAPGL